MKRHTGIAFVIFITFILMSKCAYALFIPQITGRTNGRGRKQYANEMMISLKKIDECIPALSPSQKKWLQEEDEAYKRTNNYNRYREIMDSKEYLMDSVKNQTNSILANLSLITEINHQKTEVHLWSLITEALLDLSYWQNVNSITKLGTIDEKMFSTQMRGDSYSLFLNNGLLPAVRILRHIIQPHLGGTLPD